MDVLTLVTMIVASVLGSYLMAGIVSKFDRKHVRYALFVGLFLLSIIMFMKWRGIGPFGEVGTAMGLRGIKLIIAIVVNFILGGLMSIGVGLYAPCMALTPRTRCRLRIPCYDGFLRIPDGIRQWS